MKETLIVVSKSSEDDGIYYIVHETDLSTRLFLSGPGADYIRADAETETHIIEDWRNAQQLHYEQPIFSWHIARVKFKQ